MQRHPSSRHPFQNGDGLRTCAAVDIYSGMPDPDEAPPVSGSPAADRTNPSVRAMDALRRVVRAISTSARGHGRVGEVSGAQRFVMRQLRAAPGITVRELAERTLARQGTVAEVVAKLVAGGLVTRTASLVDARQVVLTLTARGRRSTIRAGTTVQERLVDGLARLSADRRLVLAESLEAWLEAAGLVDTPVRMLLDEPLPEPKPRVVRKPAVTPPTSSGG